MGYKANYVSAECFKRYFEHLAKPIKCRQAKICSAHGCSHHGDQCYRIQRELYSETNTCTKPIEFIARVVEDLPYDFIIGLQTIRKYRLTRVFDYIFNESDTQEDDQRQTSESRVTSGAVRRAKRHKSESITSQSSIVEIRAKEDHQHHCICKTQCPPRGYVDHQRDLHHCANLQCPPVNGGYVDPHSFQPSLTIRSLGNGTTCMPCEYHCANTQSPQQWGYAEHSTGAAPSGQYVSPVVAPLSNHTILADNMTLASADSDILKALRSAKINRLNLTFTKDQLLDVEHDTDHLDEYLDDTPHDMILNQDMNMDVDHGSLKSVNFEGDKQLQSKGRALMKKYSKCLSKSLNKEAARIKPFQLTLKEGEPGTQWLDATVNKQPARQQTSMKQKALDEFITEALTMGIIEPSQATSWSQVHLVPKPNGKWRFCIDFRRLNDATKSLGWPLPHIKEMLERIGSRHPKHFAVLDLTSGYYQAAISKQSRELTAFRTSKGLYQWTRLPMGLKGAPSYFQHAMQQMVLSDLLYTACEVYLDDIIVYGETEDEFLRNLELVFQRLEKYNITLNPEKVRIGLSSIEYVGHTIDKDGLSFSKEKIQDVWDAPLPTTKKQLKSFLGLCVQFKDHVPNYSTMVQPLHNLLPNYSKKEGNHPVGWSSETKERFEDIKKAINDCPKLFFVDPHAPVFLHTDASDYGIGGYLFQLIDGKHRPIIFLSKSLSKTERKWSVYEKEGYAIFYSFMKMEHLLRDIHFTLKTDHRNLIFINTDLRDKVKRWKLAIQHFDFNVDHIEGEKNIEADGFSRLITIPKEEELEQNEIDTNQLFVLRAHTERESRIITDRLPQEVYDKIKTAHNSDVGHFGVERTLARLRSLKYKWPFMRKHVKHFIKRCPICQKLSAIKPVINTEPYTLASYEPFGRICVDTIGPLPTDNENQNKYILVIIDAFSRFVRLYPILDTTAESAADSLLDWVGLFGIPLEIVSDNGTQFANSLIEGLLSALEITDAKIQAYSKEENGIVERANKEVNRHLRTIVYNRMVKKRWSKYLPLVQRIMNASTHRSTGFQPAQIVFGNAVNLERNLLPLEHPPNNTNPHEYLDELMRVQREIIEIARRNQEKTDLFHLSQRGGKEITEFPPDSYVLVNYEGEGHRPPTKLHTNLRGPVKVVSNEGPIYTVKDLTTEKLYDFHVKLLHPFDFDTAIIDPTEVARHDEDYFDIARIENHRFTGTKKNRTDLEFLIVFDGDSKATWQPWSIDLSRNEKVHTYLRNHQMVKYIPAKYTWPKDHPEHEKPVKRTKDPHESTKRKRRKPRFGRY